MEARLELRILFSAGEEESDEGVSSEAVELVVNVAGCLFVTKAEVEAESEEAF